MSKSRKVRLPEPAAAAVPGYEKILGGVVQLLEQARRASARAVNALMTATYWDIGRRIVEFEQRGKDRSQYGAKLLERLSADLTAKFGRGFGYVNLTQMRRFYLSWPRIQILQTPSEEFAEPPQAEGNRQSASVDLPKIQTLSEESEIAFDDLARRFPLPWSHYVMLLKVEKPEARAFYETEALRNGWTVRQLERQITTLFFERTLASRNKSAMLKKGAVPTPAEELSPEEEFKDPFVLEFLGLKDEYSESDLEEALIRELETFLLELGGDFTFVGRQKRLRIGDDWYRIDLLFFHRKLRCLVIIDLRNRGREAGHEYTLADGAAFGQGKRKREQAQNRHLYFFNIFEGDTKRIP